MLSIPAGKKVLLSVNDHFMEWLLVKGLLFFFNVMTSGVIISGALSLLKIKDMKLPLAIFSP